MANGTIAAGSNIKFLLGTQDNLEKYISKNGATAENGAFYLTQDTHRLYVGTSDGHAVPVNEGVISVDRVSALPTTNAHPGEFYYAKEENILCVYAGPKNAQTGKGGWVQINSNTDTYIVDATTKAKLAGNVATFTQDFFQNDNTMPYSDGFEIEVADGIKIEVTAGGDTNTPPRVKLTGVLNKEFTVASTSGVEAATVTLTDSFDRTVDFKIKAKDGSNIKIAKGSGANEVEIDVNDMYNSGMEVVAYDSTDANNNPSKKTGFSFGVIDGNGGQYADFNPGIRVGKDKTQLVVFDDGVANLPVYTQTEIDDIKKALNSMTYRGLVSQNGGNGASQWSTIYTSTTVSVGDTYMFAADTTHYPTGSSTGVPVSKGTLVIARGTEDPNTGYITGNIQWDFVESTVDTDTTYKLSATPTAGNVNGSIQLVGMQGSGYVYGESVTFADGVAIEASVAVDGSGNATVIFNHETITTQRPNVVTVEQGRAGYSTSAGSAETETEVTVVKAIETNAQGHVIKVETNTLKLKDTNATIADLGIDIDSVSTVANTSSEVTLVDRLQLVDGTGQPMTAKTSNWKMKSQSLTFNKNSASEVSIDLVWGTF